MLHFPDKKKLEVFFKKEIKEMGCKNWFIRKNKSGRVEEHKMREIHSVADYINHLDTLEETSVS